MPELEKPLVSICMITYNHEQYIEQAIESVLKQQADFKFELVIGEDCSTDRTRDIIRVYRERYPERIRLLLPERNQGMHINLAATLKACRGKYIALCEGDDYWTDPHKLQKQVAFLDNHSDYSICFHNVLRVNENNITQRILLVPWKLKEFYVLDDLLAENFIPTCSTMFRAGLFGEFPGWYYSMPQGDWPLHILNAHFGKIGYIKETMCVYRVHNGGIWSPLDLIQRINLIFEASDIIKKNLGLDPRKKIPIEYRYKYKLFRTYLKRGELVKARSCVRDAVIGYHYWKDIPYFRWMQMVFLVIAPKLYNLLKRVLA